VTSKGLILTGTMDSPAKADVQHHIHHNGQFGCPFCLNPGESASTGKKGGSAHVYRCLTHAGRTHDGNLKSAKEALETGKPVRLNPQHNPPICSLHTSLVS